MQARYDELTVETQGDGEIVDLTSHAQKAIANHGFSDGLCNVFVAHSTCGVTTIEYEPGCNQDFNATLEKLAPQDDRWEHNERNADTNGHSHVRAALVGPSVTIPFSGSELHARHLAEGGAHRLRRPAPVAGGSSSSCSGR